MDLSPLYISIKTSILSTIITFFIGIFVSYKMAYYNGKNKGILYTLLTSTFNTSPPTVIGFFLSIMIWQKRVYRKNIFNI